MKIHVENDIVVLTFSNVVQFNIEKHNVVSSLFYVVNFHVDICNVVSTLIWRCGTSWRHINLKTTLNRRWNVCWVVSIISPPISVKSLSDRVCRMILVIIIQSRYYHGCLEYPFLHSVHLQELDFSLFHSGIFVHVKLFVFVVRKSNFRQSITNKVQTNKQLFKENMNKQLIKVNMRSF